VKCRHPAEKLVSTARFSLASGCGTTWPQASKLITAATAATMAKHRNTCLMHIFYLSLFVLSAYFKLAHKWLF
jgi:hypothetical protein